MQKKMNECTLLFANVNESMSSSTWWKQLKKEGIIILVRWGFKKDFKKKNFTYKERRPTSTYLFYYSKIAMEHFLVNLRKGKNFLIM
jgi:hypothetical protein